MNSWSKKFKKIILEHEIKLPACHRSFTVNEVSSRYVAKPPSYHMGHTVRYNGHSVNNIKPEFLPQIFLKWSGVQSAGFAAQRPSILTSTAITKHHFPLGVILYSPMIHVHLVDLAPHPFPAPPRPPTTNQGFNMWLRQHHWMYCLPLTTGLVQR